MPALTEIKAADDHQRTQSKTTAELSGNETLVRLPLAMPTPRSVVALGGELKNTICVVRGNIARISALHGDLGFPQNLRAFSRAVETQLAELVDGDVVFAHDLHPAYLTTQYARRLGRNRGTASAALRCVGVQHHHAHVLACMAEHGVTEPVIGVACDGAGYGTDGAVWGGEVLLVAPTAFERRAHLRYFALPGGDTAARETWRPALALVYQAFGDGIPQAALDRFRSVPDERFVRARQLLQQGSFSPQTSSLGRLFDAAAFLLGLAELNDVEGLAARRLEETAGDADGPPYPYRLAPGRNGVELDVREMIRGLVQDVDQGVQAKRAAARFHATVARMLGMAAASNARACGVRTVALSGGCFANRLLRRLTNEYLIESGIERVLMHQRVSCGDAGIALGQAFGAAARVLETQ